MAVPTEYEGKRFGRLVCLVRRGNVYQCICDCGKTAFVRTDKLTEGRTKSCGCYRQDIRNQQKAERIERNRKPPKPRTPIGDKRLRAVWGAMVSRCTKPSNKDYMYYGARGVGVCNEWLSSKEAFVEWANDSGYKTGKWLERIDNDLGYSPDNCMWRTAKGQARNRRNNLLVTGRDGQMYSLPQYLEYANRASQSPATYNAAYRAYKQLAQEGVVTADKLSALLGTRRERY